MFPKRAYKPGERALTFKEKLFVNTLTSTLSPGEAARSAGLDTNAAKAVMERPVVQRAIEAAFKEKGITREDVAVTLKRNLNAKTPVYSRQGNYLGDKEEHMAQLKAVEILLKVWGDFAPTKTEGTTRHILDLFGEDDEKAAYRKMIGAQKPIDIADAEVIEEKI